MRSHRGRTQLKPSPGFPGRFNPQCRGSDNLRIVTASGNASQPSGTPSEDDRVVRRPTPPRKPTGNSLIRQRVAFNKFKNQEVCLAVLLKPVNSGNVRMVQRGKHFCFTFKPGQAIRILCKLLSYNRIWCLRD